MSQNSAASAPEPDDDGMELDDAAAVVIIPDDGDDDGDAPDVEIGDTTVIVEPSADSNAPAIDPLTERIMQIENTANEALSVAYEARAMASNAEAAADVALEETSELAENDEDIIAAVDAADEEIIENVEDAEESEDGDGLDVDEIEPASARVHPLFRPARDWFGK